MKKKPKVEITELVMLAKVKQFGTGAHVIVPKKLLNKIIEIRYGK